MIERQGTPHQPTNEDPDKSQIALLEFGIDRLTFEVGTKITGMKNWDEVNSVVNQMVNGIVTTLEPNPDTEIHFKIQNSLAQRIQRHETTKGFHGRKNTDFEIEILPVDLSLDRSIRKEPPDPSLARTIKLTRRIFSSALPKAGELVSTACTIVITDHGISPRPNIRSSKPKIHYFYGSIGLKDLSEHVFNKFQKSAKSVSSVGINRIRTRK